MYEPELPLFRRRRGASSALPPRSAVSRLRDRLNDLPTSSSVRARGRRPCRSASLRSCCSRGVSSSSRARVCVCIRACDELLVRRRRRADRLPRSPSCSPSPSSPRGASSRSGSADEATDGLHLVDGQAALARQILVASGRARRPGPEPRRTRSSLWRPSSKCTGTRMVLLWSAMARAMAWRTHHAAYVEKPVTAAPVELLDRADQAELPFLHEVVHVEPLAHETASICHHQAEVRAHELVLGARRLVHPADEAATGALIRRHGHAQSRDEPWRARAARSERRASSTADPASTTAATAPARRPRRRLLRGEGRGIVAAFSSSFAIRCWPFGRVRPRPPPRCEEDRRRRSRARRTSSARARSGRRRRRSAEQRARPRHARRLRSDVRAPPLPRG